MSGNRWNAVRVDREIIVKSRVFFVCVFYLCFRRIDLHDQVSRDCDYFRIKLPQKYFNWLDAVRRSDSLSLCLSLTPSHTHAHTYTPLHTHTHTHTHLKYRIEILEKIHGSHHIHSVELNEFCRTYGWNKHVLDIIFYENVYTWHCLFCGVKVFKPFIIRNIFKKTTAETFRQIKFNGLNQCHGGSISGCSACK